MKNKLLPIGTVVLLRGGIKKIMITGYHSKNIEGKVYDYNGCIFPEGYVENTFCLFNQDQIEEILFRGLRNEEYEEYIEQIHTNTRKEEKAGTSGRIEKEMQTVTKEKEGRTPASPTNPLSVSEMKSMYGIEKISGEK